MSKYNLLGNNIEFSKAEDAFFELQSFLWEAISNSKQQYILWYNLQKSAKNTLSNGTAFANSVIDTVVLDILYSDLAKKYEIYGVSKSEYTCACRDISAVEDVFDDAITIYNDIEEQLQEELEEREYNEELRRAGQISFGIGDSIKNAASNAAHGIAKSSGNSKSRDEADRRKAKLYDDLCDPLWEALKKSIVETITKYQEFVNEKKPNTIEAYFDREASTAYLENAKSVTDKREELLIEAFKKCPWNQEVYSYIFAEYPNERRNLVDISKNYDVSLEDDIYFVLSKEYTDTAKCNEELAVRIKIKIKSTMLDWGVEHNRLIDEIEKDCLDRLTLGYDTASEERCNELKVQLANYDALDNNKKPYFEKLQGRIEDIWKKEDGEIFDNYLKQINILSVKAVEEGKKFVKTKARTADSEKYLTAIANCNPANVKRARIYHLMSKTTISAWIFKLLGIAFIAFGWIYGASVEEFTLIDALPILIGIIYQIYYFNIKKRWKCITVNGTVVHPLIVCPYKEFQKKYSETAKENAISKTKNTNVDKK